MHRSGKFGSLGAQSRPLRDSTLRTGRTRFLDLAEPVLGFQRGEGAGAILCLFNLSPVAREVVVTGVGAATGPSMAAVLEGDRLALGPNAVAFLPVTGKVTVSG